MYKIISVVDGDTTIFMVFNKLTKKEIARYFTYEEALQDLLSRN